jgi:hypothetical protein
MACHLQDADQLKPIKLYSYVLNGYTINLLNMAAEEIC